MSDGPASKCLAEYIVVLGELQSALSHNDDSSASANMGRQMARMHLACLKEIMDKNGADFAAYGVPVKAWDEL